MWTLKTTALSVVMDALGKVSKRADKYLDQIPGNPKIQNLTRNILCYWQHFYVLHFSLDVLDILMYHLVKSVTIVNQCLVAFDFLLNLYFLQDDKQRSRKPAMNYYRQT